jgi:hypothetical protein
MMEGIRRGRRQGARLVVVVVVVVMSSRLMVAVLGLIIGTGAV